MIIKVDFLPGTNLEEAVKQAKQALTFYNSYITVEYIEFKFNGVRISVGINTDADKILEQYLEGREYIND